MGGRDIYYVDRFYSSFQLFPVWSDCWSPADDIAGLQLANVHDYWHYGGKAKQKNRPSTGRSPCQIRYRTEWDWLCLVVWLSIINSFRFLYLDFKGLYWVDPPLRQYPVLTGVHARPPALINPGRALTFSRQGFLSRSADRVRYILSKRGNPCRDPASPQAEYSDGVVCRRRSQFGQRTNSCSPGLFLLPVPYFVPESPAVPAEGGRDRQQALRERCN